MSERPFRVLGVQQIAIGGRDKAALARLWTELLGIDKVDSFRSEAENVDEDILRCGGVEIDLMQPIDPERKPRVDSPALNHVGLWIDDLDAAVSWLGERGVEFTPGGIRTGAGGHRVCFIHPKRGGEGVLIELVEAASGRPE